MFIKLVRINQEGNEKEIVIDTSKVVFITETEPHVNYDKVIGYEETEDENGVITKVPNEWETERRFLVAFDNGRHPQFLDETNYNLLKDALLK